MGPPLYMDNIKAPLNPCSVETIQEPVELANGAQVWPLVVACYELDEKTGQRHGRADLYGVVVPNITSTDPSMPLSFDNEQTFTKEGVSGILDGKWVSIPGRKRSWCYCSAHSNGEMRAYEFVVPSAPDEGLPLLDSDPLYSIRQAGVAPKPDSFGDALCLSVNWDASQKDDASETRRIVSTYSNGHVAIHDVVFMDDSIQFILRDVWSAHTMFTSPAEVWSACFAHTPNGNLVLSCGDEGTVKFWDVRSTNRPVQVLKCFEAGVTCASQHPRHPHLVACGSYDETICLIDTRYPSTEVERTRPMGGGIWRLKWHPVKDNRLLVAAMHGGCRVVRVNDFHETEKWQLTPSVKIRKQFNEHESMAYGADWLVCQHPTQNGFFEAAASCSFYDRNVFLWDTVF